MRARVTSLFQPELGRRNQAKAGVALLPYRVRMDWRLRRAAKPIRDEAEEAVRCLRDAPDDWKTWWAERGERELRCILMTAWDPIGVGDVPEAWDEYENYLSAVAQRLREGKADADDGLARLAEYLDHVAKDFMEIAPPSGVRNHLSAALVAWHEWSFERAGRPPREWIDDT